ncbi:Thermostable beta-glucosidase B [compost metagenome]
MVGYRWYDAKKEQPLFAFGHGLSYTTFDFDKLEVKQKDAVVLVRFRVQNVGSRDGVCIPQLYLGFPEGSGEPPKQLKACRKAAIPAGGSADISFELDRRAFSIWCTATNCWVLPGKAFTIMIGRSSSDLVLEQRLEIHNTFMGEEQA